jgi:hypothetical protein
MHNQDDIGYSGLDEMSLKNQSESVSVLVDDDKAFANAENELLAMLPPVNSDCYVPSYTLGSVLTIRNRSVPSFLERNRISGVVFT